MKRKIPISLLGSFVVLGCSRPKALEMKCSVGNGLLFDANAVYCSGIDGVHRLPKKGGADTVVFAVDIVDIYQSEKAPYRIALDTDRIYLLPSKVSKGEPLVRSIAKTGGAPIDVVKLDAPEEEHPKFFAIDSTNVYVLTLGPMPIGDERNDPTSTGVLLAAPKAGGPKTILARDLHFASGIALDDANVYWSEHGTYTDDSKYDYKNDGAIKSVPKSGGAVKTLAAKVDYPNGLAQNGSELVFSTGGHFVNTGGTWTEVIGPMSIPKAGGAPAPTTATCFLSSGDSCFGLRSEIIGQGLYGAKTRQFVERWPKGGGKHKTVYTTEHDIFDLAIDDDGTLYWLQGVDYRLMRFRP